MEGKKIYAIVEIAGKQYRVKPGDIIDVDFLNKVEGEALEFDKVLLIGEDDNVTIGKPVVEGAKVMATSQGTFRGKKVIVYKYKPKVRYRKKNGHHQEYTRLTIEGIKTSQGESLKEEAVSGA